MNEHIIKCRAKRMYKEKKWDGWITGFLVPVVSRNVMTWYIVNEIRGGSINGSPIDPSTVGRSTGVQDINGREIFEGDIVRYRVTDERYTKNPRYVTTVVEWDGYYAQWGLKGFLKSDFLSHRLEVLGNIYDNPEPQDK